MSDSPAPDEEKSPDATSEEPVEYYTPIFEWAIHDTRSNLLKRLIVQVTLGAIGPGLLFLALWGLSLWSVSVAWWVGVVLTVLIFLILLLAVLGSWAEDKDPLLKHLLRRIVY